jgi:hypothetical protein
MRIPLAALLALAVLSASPSRAQDAPSAVDRMRAAALKQKAMAQKPAPPTDCEAPDPALKGRTDYYDRKGVFLRGSKSGAPEDAIVIFPGNSAAAFKAAVSRPCPEGQVLDDRALRRLGQAYAIEEFIRFDSPRNRVKLANGLISEMRTQLYKGADGVVHIGREKIVSGNATEVAENDRNEGGSGYEKQGPDKTVGRLHTHPNSDSHEMLGVPRHHPSPADVSTVNEYGYCDVVVSPLYIFLINNRAADSMVFARHDAFGENPVKAYVKKAAEADAYYAQHKSFPAWFNDDFNRKNNPWAQ